MKEYINLVETVFDNGKVKTNRTGTNTLMYFGFHYKVDLSKGFPLLTTKKVFFNSIIRELLWYLSGQTHIRNLRKHTKIWDAWTNANKNWEIGKMQICTFRVKSKKLENALVGLSFRGKSKSWKI